MFLTKTWNAALHAFSVRFLISLNIYFQEQHAIHELGHAMGFVHEQSRSDAGDYVKIIWENIRDGNSQWFQIKESFDYGVPYDYFSAMHYGASVNLLMYSYNQSRALIFTTALTTLLHAWLRLYFIFSLCCLRYLSIVILSCVIQLNV